MEETITLLAHEQGKAVLLTTHIMPLAEKLADRIFIIRQGKEVAFDVTSALLQRFHGPRTIIEIETATPLSSSFKAELHAAYPSIGLNGNNDASTLIWYDARQSDVLGLLRHLDRHGVEIKKYGRRQANLEEIFVALTSDENPSESEIERS